MNIIFFGSSEFSMPSLRAILNSRHKVLALVTQPDRKKGRRLRPSPPPTKVLALADNIPVYQPETASSPESIRYLKSLNPDIFVVVSFGQILKRGLLEVPKMYSVNLHGSLLPKYRGAAPINWAIIKGEGSTGATVIRMDEGMDSGDIIASDNIAIGEDDTSLTMNEKIAETGVGLLMEAIEAAENGSVKFKKQDESEATYAPKLKKTDGLIDWTAGALEIHNLVRGLIPWPGAYTHHNTKALKIFKTEVIPPHGEKKPLSPGAVIDVMEGRGIFVNTGRGVLLITHLQLEGKKILDAAALLRGHRITPGEILR